MSAKPQIDGHTRRAWDDRFQQPSVEQLREALSEDACALFDRLREHLLGIKGLSEEVVWYGPSWRWSVQYSAAGLKEPLAVLVPSPEDLQLAMQLDREVADTLSNQPFKRAIRDGLDLAREPFDTRWAVWSVQFANLLDEMCKLIDLKHQIVMGE